MMLMLMMTMMMMMSRRRMIAVRPGARETKLWLSKETIAGFLKSCIVDISMVMTVDMRRVAMIMSLMTTMMMIISILRNLEVFTYIL